MQFLTLQKARSCLSRFQVGFVRLRIPVTRRCSESCPDFSQWGELLWYSWWFVYFLRPLDESSFKTWIKMTQTIINRIKTGIWKVTFLQNTGKMMEQVCEVDSRQRANRFEECEAAESAQSHFSEGPSCLVLDAFVLYAMASNLLYLLLFFAVCQPYGSRKTNEQQKSIWCKMNIIQIRWEKNITLGEPPGFLHSWWWWVPVLCNNTG